MHLLLLVSMQAKITVMEVYEINVDSISNKTQKKDESLVPLVKEKILCKHCKRTTSNGIRCMGICVADNEY